MSKKNLEKYNNIVQEILENEEFKLRKNYKHHGKITVYQHCKKVSLLAYKIAYYIPTVNEKNAAIAGLLHDFYYNPWMENKNKKSFFKKHGFVHAKEARDNAYKVFPNLMNKRIENSILRHMFPLNIVPPRYMESWIVTISDKIISMETIFDKETIPRSLGLKRKC